MRCPKVFMRITGSFHILSLLISLLGILIQIYSIGKKRPFSPALSIALTIVLIIKLPNQICIACKESYGWISVVGTTAGIILFSVLSYLQYLNYVNINKNNKNNRNNYNNQNNQNRNNQNRNNQNRNNQNNQNNQNNNYEYYKNNCYYNRNNYI